MKFIGHRIFFAVVAAILALAGKGDDAVGVFKVDVESNDEVVVEMPLNGLGNGSRFTAGPFAGDGGEGSDRLYVFSAADGTWTNAYFSSTNGWIDPATGEVSTMKAVAGDTILFSPGLDVAFEPFTFWLYGKAPGVSAHSGSPKIYDMSVDPFGAFADFSVFTRGLTTDIFQSDFSTNATDAVSWLHLGRFPGNPVFFNWRDPLLPQGGGRVYLASDATRDTDGDGIPDEMERLIYGTNPLLADTDGDGIDDRLELAWGSNPLVGDAQTPQMFFSEPFEPPEVVSGPLAGQNGWNAAPTSSPVIVQSEIVYEGSGAVELKGGSASHSVTTVSDVVWLDLREYPLNGTSEETISSDAFAGFWINDDGNPVMTDGDALFTNAQHFVSGYRRWMRSTLKFDFSARVWDLYVDGVIVGEGLAMRGNATTLSSVEFSGAGNADSITVTATRPQGLSSDGDSLPDEWEMEHFGDLSHDGAADSDADGMSDLEEFRAGTDPLAPNGDSDGDGLPDWWEAANGLNPFSTNDFAHVAFREGFELPNVMPGDIAGQNGWTVSRTNAIEVQSAEKHEGTSALMLKQLEDGITNMLLAAHSAQSRAEVVWMDVWIAGTAGSPIKTPDAAQFALVGFDGSGHPVLLDGDMFITNTAVRAKGSACWTRCTCRYDFPNRLWDFYLDGVLVNECLAMHGNTGSMHELSILGGSGFVDDIYVGFARPQGLSSDGDTLPDEWEFRNFGNLDNDGNGDFDGDGLSDAEEFAAGTNPALADSDGDGMSDGWETDNGLNPAIAENSDTDTDGDGLSDFDEFIYGTDPNNSDSDGDGLPDGIEHRYGWNPHWPGETDEANAPVGPFTTFSYPPEAPNQTPPSSRGAQ